MAEAKMSQPSSEPRRACEECNRKKTKCDMKHPVCGLCLRTGNTCHFPSKRKKPVSRKPQLKAQSRQISDSLAKLVQVLEAASRSEGENDPSHTRQGVTQSVLRDSLKGFLAEIDSSQTQASDDHGPFTQHRNIHSSPTDDEEIDGEEQQPNEDGSDNTLNRRSTSLTDQDVESSSSPTIVVGTEEITCSLAIDLVNLFFEKVQLWLPLLHRPRFQAHFEPKLLVDGDVMKGLSIDETFLFYSMFALSARFSNHSTFNNISTFKRGHWFAERARQIYTRARPTQTPSLTYLQGCILLANYFYTSGPTPQGWILIGVCVRLAYDLGLSEIDDEDWTPVSPIGSTDKEELRRAWWLVWELDTFASCVSRKPYAIDRKRMAVMLPISDEAWFAGIEIQSAELLYLPGQSWRSLSGSSNQDERAWFLVANHFMATIHDRLQQRQDVSMDEKMTLQNEIVCFKLALPASLRLEAEYLTFTPETFAKCNWVIGIHLMLMSASFMVSGIATADADDRSVSSASNSSLPSLRTRAIELSRIIGVWDARYIALAHPFLTCMMLPPYAVDGEILRTQPLIVTSHELAKLVLGHFGEKWKLGRVVSGKTVMICARSIANTF